MAPCSNGTIADRYEKLLGTLAEMWQTGRHSDFQITCGDRTFKVHKAILEPQSTYFRGLWEGSFKESTAGCAVFHSNSSPWDIANGDDPDALRRIIAFCYGLRNWYHVDKACALADLDMLEQLAIIFATAGKYLMPDAQCAALRRFWEVALMSLDQRGDEDSCQARHRALENVLKFLYGNEGMHFDVLRTALLHLFLERWPAASYSGYFEAAIQEFPDLAVDVARAYVYRLEHGDLVTFQAGGETLIRSDDDGETERCP